MNGITPEEIRPILEVIDDYKIQIEDTSYYTSYESGGFATGANYVKVKEYTSF